MLVIKMVYMLFVAESAKKRIEEIRSSEGKGPENYKKMTRFLKTTK